VKYCSECGDFPCERLQHLDRRYKTHFRMSMIDNLQYIKRNGIKPFLQEQEEKWHCLDCGGVISCHNGLCFHCSLDELRQKKQKYRWEDIAQRVLDFYLETLEKASSKKQEPGSRQPVKAA
jgi:hypothetical protein